MEEISRSHHWGPHDLTGWCDERLLTADLDRLGIAHLIRDKEGFLAVHGDRLHRLHDLKHSIGTLDELAAGYHLLHLLLWLLLLWHLFGLELDYLLCDRAIGLLDLNNLLLRLIILELDVLLREIDDLLRLRRGRVQRFELLLVILLAILLRRLSRGRCLKGLNLSLELGSIGSVQLVELLSLSRLLREKVLKLLQRYHLRLSNLLYWLCLHCLLGRCRGCLLLLLLLLDSRLRRRVLEDGCIELISLKLTVEV